jgi:hypothetical protein
MRKRLTTIGLVLAVIGLGFVIGGGVAFSKAQEGYGSLQAFSEAQNVNLQYNEEGQLIDRGSPETAQEILSLLADDWGYPVVEGHLDPADPLVNTATEYMFQMATVGYHILHGTHTVVLEEDVEYNGEVFPAGSYDFEVDGRYWTDFDRMHPIEGAAREMAWSGTAHGLFGELGVGTVTHSALQLALALAGLFAGIGATLILAGLGLVWVSRGELEIAPAKATEATAPESKKPVGV